MVGSSVGVKSPDVFGAFSSSPACGSTLKESIPLNPLHPKSSLELSVSTTVNAPDDSSLISKAVYVRYRDHVFFRNIEVPAAQAIIREALGWVKEENDEVILLECDRPLLECHSGFNGVVVVKSCILAIAVLDFEYVLNCPHTYLKNRVCASSQRSEKLTPKKQKRSDKN